MQRQGVLFLNFTACVLFVNKLPGALAARMQLRASFFEAFTDIGSAHARSFLLAKLARAAAEPVAAQLRAEVDGPAEASTGRQSSDTALRTWLESRLNALEGMVRASSLRAPAHGVLEITRSSVTSFSQQLESIGTPVDDSHRATIAAEGGPLHVSVFLRDMGVRHDLIRRLMPSFSSEVARRKLDHYNGVEGLKPPLWIAWSQAAWRLYYTEADRELLCAVFDDPSTKNNMDLLERSCQAARPDAPVVARPRSGPYGRVMRGGSHEISSGSIQRFFGSHARMRAATSSVKKLSGFPKSHDPPHRAASQGDGPGELLDGSGLFCSAPFSSLQAACR